MQVAGDRLWTLYWVMIYVKGGFCGQDVTINLPMKFNLRRKHFVKASFGSRVHCAQGLAASVCKFQDVNIISTKWKETKRDALVFGTMFLQSAAQCLLSARGCRLCIFRSFMVLNKSNYKGNHAFHNVDPGLKRYSANACVVCATEGTCHVQAIVLIPD